MSALACIVAGVVTYFALCGIVLLQMVERDEKRRELIEHCHSYTQCLKCDALFYPESSRAVKKYHFCSLECQLRYERADAISGYERDRDTGTRQN